MKLLYAALLPLLAAVSASSPLLVDEDQDLVDLDMDAVRMEFGAWMKTFGKTYESTEEMLERMRVWTRNHVFIERHNHQSNPKSTYELGHNQFSDMTWEEYKQYNKLGEYSAGIKSFSNPRSDTSQMEYEATIESAQLRMLESQSDLPDEVNWITEGAVPPVKNQGMCGSCWAFSAVGAIEGRHYLDTGVLISLSEQELLDCDKLDMGCGGGLMDNAFLFDENSTGICSEEDYPYVQHKRWWKGCASERGLCEGVDHTRVQTFIDIENTVDAMMEALSVQPVSIAIEADQQSFQFYKSGVYADPECGNRLDHGVLAVGYGTEPSDDDTEEGVDYFLVRNSWGATWGDEGYIKMARQSDNVNGTCGILSFGSRPILRDDESRN